MPIPSTIATLTESPAEPLTLDLLISHANIVATDEDPLLEQYIAEARESVETDAQISLIRRTIRQRWQRFPGRQITLDVWPLVSVESVKYIDPDGTEQTLGESEYIVDIDRRPGAVFLKPANAWPSIECGRPDSVSIEYTAGFDPDDKPAPARAIQAMALLAGHSYKHREAAIVGTISSELALGYSRLIKLLSKERYIA